MQTTLAKIDHNEYLILWFTYLLYILVLPSVLGVIINYFKSEQFNRDDMDLQIMKENTDFDTISSHHVWLMHTFLTMVIFSMAAVGTAYYGVGYIVGLLAAIWWAYRIIRGVYCLATHKHLPIDY